MNSSSRSNIREIPLDQSRSRSQPDSKEELDQCRRSQPDSKEEPSKNATGTIEEPEPAINVTPKRKSKRRSTKITFVIDRDEINDVTENCEGSSSILEVPRCFDEDIKQGIRGRGVSRARSRVSIVKHDAYSRLFGETYNVREAHFVILTGALMAFNSGFVNGCCVSGLLDPHREARTSVTGFANSYTKSALDIAVGNWEHYGISVALITSYMFGAFICGLITPKATSYRIEPTYGPTFLIGGCFLLAASILAALEFNTVYVFCLAAAANGIQNGIASLYSANLIRCSLTGSFTDIPLTSAQVLRGNREGIWKSIVLAMLVGSFWLGAVVSFYAVSHFLTYTLYFNAGLFFLVGCCLIAFLVKEIGISVWAAMVGNWRWKKARKTLRKLDSLRSMGSQLTLYELFDKIDNDGSGTITPDEFLDALLEANVKISGKELRVLMKAMDANGDGVIDREEWNVLVEKIQGNAAI